MKIFRSTIFIGFVGTAMLLVSAVAVFAATPRPLGNRLAGRILLQVESLGTAWYIDPRTETRFCLGKPDDAYAIMRSRGLGISNKNLAKIPEAESSAVGDAKLRSRLSGLILLQVEAHGEAWYVDPKTRTRQYLGRPDDAHAIMRRLGLGITNATIQQIAIGSECLPPVTVEIPREPVLAVPPVETPQLSKEQPKASTEVSPPGAATLHADAARVVTIINERRAAAGLPALFAERRMSAVAQTFAADMRARNYFANKTPEGKDTEQMLLDGGYEVASRGAFVAKGPTDPVTVVDLWVSSDTEEVKSILRSSFDEIGVGYLPRDGSVQSVWVVIIAQSGDRITARLSNRTAMVARILELTNAARVACAPSECPVPLQPLTLNTQLMTAAQGHADDMFNRGFYGHDNPNGEGVAERATRAGYRWSTVGENIAHGQESAEVVMDGWLKSPGHRANILKAAFTEIGIGVNVGRNAALGFTTYWVQNFGKQQQ